MIDLPPATIARIVRAWRAGHTISVIASSLRITEAEVVVTLGRMGADLRCSDVAARRACKLEAA